MRQIFATTLLLLVAAGLSAHKPTPEKTDIIWVLTLFRPLQPPFVSDSYVDADRAVRAAQHLTVAAQTWARVDESQLHTKKHLASLFLAPSVLHAQLPDITGAVVLPEVARVGTFTSPSVDIAADTRTAGITIQISALDRFNPAFAMSTWVEQFNGAAWEFRCGISTTGALNEPVAEPSTRCNITPNGQPVRAQTKTCYSPDPTLACALPAVTLTVGSSVQLYQ